jgi:hypothetical protein
MIYQAAKTIKGGKKATMEATAITDPSTRKLVVSLKDIKEVTLKYCLETLKDNKPKEGLNTLQHWFLPLLLRQGPGAPSSSLLWETGMLNMELRVWVEKVMMIIHIKGLKEDSLAQKMWREQRAFSWPGLANECKEIYSVLGTEDANVTLIDRHKYRKYTIKACYTLNEKRLREDMASKVKCERIRDVSYGRKEYFSCKTPHQTREMYATRLSMLPRAGNFSHNLKEKYGNMEDDIKLAGFFQETLARRKDFDQEKDKRRQEEAYKQ